MWFFRSLKNKSSALGGLASEACLKKAFEDLDKEVLRNQPPGLGEVVARSHLTYQNSLLLHQLRLVVHPIIYEVYIYIYPRVVQNFFHQQ